MTELTKCNRCGLTIRYVKTEYGKWMPCDPFLLQGGIANYKLIDRFGKMHARPTMDVWGYNPHFRTCKVEQGRIAGIDIYEEQEADIEVVGYFDGCNTEKDISQRYKELAKKYHPDLGGDHRIMVKINREYSIKNNL